jgi:cob(I)alamin adenosyltransferase
MGMSLKSNISSNRKAHLGSSRTQVRRAERSGGALLSSQHNHPGDNRAKESLQISLIVLDWSGQNRNDPRQEIEETHFELV